MKIYIIKLVFRGVSPMIWRRFQVSGNTSLAQLHQLIQIAYDWDDDYLHQFHIYGKDYGLYREGGIMFSDNAHEVFIDDFEFDAGDKFTYEYNFFDHWVVDIRIESIEGKQTPAMINCIKGNGVFGVTKQDETHCFCQLIEVISQYNKAKPQDHKIISLIQQLRAMRFNRHGVNQRLQDEMMNEKVV